MADSITPSAAPAFNAWLDDFFTSYYRHRPVNATFIGVHDYDDRLPNFSAEGAAEVVAEMATLRDRLRRLPPEPLSRAEALDRRLAEGFLEIQAWEYRSGHLHRGNPSLAIGEAVFGVMSLFLRDFAPLALRVEAAIHRLEAIPTLLTQAQQSLRQAPLAWTERAISECDGTLAFLTGGIDLLIAEKAIHQPQLRRAADRAASAVADFRRFLDLDLRHQAAGSAACSREAFDLLLRRGHFLDQGADEIEAYAWEQLREAEARLAEGAARFGASDWRAALSRLQDLHPPADQYQNRFQGVWEQHKQAAEAHDLLTWPDYPIRYVPRPVWARAAAPRLYFLFYRAPSAFDAVPVVEYLIAPLEPTMPPREREALLRATNDSVIKLNHVAHHGGIGHHVQNWHAYRAASRIGTVAAVDCASRIAMFCGGTMAEGWACYATSLMEEIGFLTPLERYGEIHARARMAARAIVDIRLHDGRFNLEEATTFYRQWTAMTATAAHSEAIKNSMFPGAALIYLVGSDMIHDLRRDLTEREGASFSLHAFHDRFLSFGSVPVALIAAAMRESPDGATGTDRGQATSSDAARS